ncbi:MAG: hypothetical protein ACI9DE_002044 [Halioglobus sp.]
MIIVEPSSSESARFGLAVARAQFDDCDEPVSADQLALAVADYDVVIVRAPASRRDLGAQFASVVSHALIPADHLCYWKWEPSRFTPRDAPQGFLLGEGADMSELEELVRDSFRSYGNHYRANPLFDRDAALDGYCEWVERLIAGGASCLVLRSADRVAVGFGLIDWSGDSPDVRLAAMAHASQGRGLYGSVLSGLMSETLRRGHDRLLISTQSDNVRVMRAWARLGLLPETTMATHHLVRRSQL